MCVNPLYIGTPISTVDFYAGEAVKHVVSIPYTSGHPFLQKLSAFSFSIAIGCQSPIHRDTHFYITSRIYREIAKLCQSPIHRDTHFY